MRCGLPQGLAILGIVTVAACGGTTTEVLGPSDTRCNITLSVAEPIPAAGGVLQVPLHAARDCTWSLELEGEGLTAEPRTGQGETTLTVSVGVNPLGRVRVLTLGINQQRFTIAQEPTPCRFAITPSDVDVPPEGAHVRVQLETLEGCAWTAIPTDPWVRVGSDRAGDRSSALLVAIHSNPGARRSSEVRIGPVTLAVRQAPASESVRGCPFSIEKGGANFPASGGQGAVRLHTRPTCAWGTTVSDPWVVIVSDSERIGTGDIQYRVEPNVSPRRRAAIIVAGGSQHIVNQAGNP